MNRATAGILAAFLACLDVVRAFEPGEWVWCELEGAFVPAPHDACPTARSDDSVFFCSVCEGFFPDPAERRHVHVRRSVEAGGQGAGSEPGGGDSSTSTEQGETPTEASPVGVYALVAGLAAAAFAIRLFLALYRRRRRRRPRPMVPVRRVWRFKDGVPEGIVVLPGSLVCSPDGVINSGTARGYAAKFCDGGQWVDAFVKRIVAGRSLSRGILLPSLRFEADILGALDGTGVAPRLFVPPKEDVAVAGESWTFYAMSIATGKSWPEHGGLGRDTRLALHALCEALEGMHAQGIGHHDLKPQNIFWDSRRKVVTLIDFGSAIDDGGRYRNPQGSSYPKSPPWVAPAADGRRLSELSISSDAWVFGLLFCEALVPDSINDVDHDKRLSPAVEKDRETLRARIGAATSPAIADAVADGLFAPVAAQRMRLSDFRAILEKEWEL